MGKQTLQKQISHHAVAIISLFIAVLALCYTAWREETTERNRTTRLAAFEMIKNLGELQLVVNSIHYELNSSRGDVILGWGNLTLISDLSHFMPNPVPKTVDGLLETWKANKDTLKTDEASVQQVSGEIDRSREAIIKVLESLR